MEFQEAIIFIAAVFILAGAGISLGMAMAGRSANKFSQDVHLEGAQNYQELIAAMDGLRQASDARKREFIESYYAATLYAPDRVVKALNTYLQMVTAPEGQHDAPSVSGARDAAVLAMREHTQKLLSSSTKLKPADLYSIEISRGADQGLERLKPPSKVEAPIPEPSKVSADTAPEPKS